MFISTLVKTAAQYDPYGEHRMNALKGVYILMMLFFVHMIYGIPNPYFNYFYVPLTALTAEIAGDTLKRKYILFFHATMGSIVAIFLFNVMVPYHGLFIVFVFFYAIAHYFVALHWVKDIFFPIPIVLSLAIYSLVYGEVNTDFYVALNNGCITFLAMCIIIACLVLFPRRYYVNIWRRSYILLLMQIRDNLKKIAKNKEIGVIVQGHLIQMMKYAPMGANQLFSKRVPLFSIFRINLLVNELRVLSCVIDQEQIKMDSDDLKKLIDALKLLIHAVEQKVPYHGKFNRDLALKENSSTEIKAFKALNKMTQAWNTVCLKI